MRTPDRIHRKASHHAYPGCLALALGMICLAFAATQGIAQVAYSRAAGLATNAELGQPVPRAALDRFGNSFLADTPNNVNRVIDAPSPFTRTPPNATIFDNVQLASGNPGTWQARGGASTGGGTIGSYTQKFNQTSPLGVTGAMEDTSTNGSGVTAGYNSLFFRHVGCSTTPGRACGGMSHMRIEIRFENVATTDEQALEFDPDYYDGVSLRYFASVQCRLRGPQRGHWFLWNGSDPKPAHRWVNSGSPCTATSIGPGLEHDLILDTTFNTATQTSTYNTMTLDGRIVFQNLGQSYPAMNYRGGAGTPNLNVEHQIDLDAHSNVSATVYIDYMKFAVW